MAGGDSRPRDVRTASGHDELASLLEERSLPVAFDPEPIGRTETPDPTGRAAPEAYPQSVASGDPTETGVVLWTRIAPDAFDPAEPVFVVVTAADPDLVDDPFADPTVDPDGCRLSGAASSDGEVVFCGRIDAPEAIAERDHTVKADLDGRLDPGAEYYYRFVHAGRLSRVGRCRTLPAADASPDSLTFGLLSCQNYLNGYYGAYGHVAREELDFVIHAGDFVYDDGAGEFKGVGSDPLPERAAALDLPSDDDRAMGLGDYRCLYRTSRSDDSLQAASEAHTFIATWDDHEVAKALHWDRDRDGPAADHPRGDDREFMLRLTADGMTAWWEYTPMRLGYDPTAGPLHERFSLWHRYAFGDLVDLLLTDERLYRDGLRDDPPFSAHLIAALPTPPSAEDAGRTMLGKPQLSWFVESVRESTAEWTVWADEVLTMPFRVGVGPLSFYPAQVEWDGYGRERRYLLHQVAAADPTNFVTLTGDMHSYVAGFQEVAADADPDAPTHVEADATERVGVEFMTPAVTSANWAESVGIDEGLPARLTRPLLARVVPAMNPHIELFDSHGWGYSTVEFTHEDCVWTAYDVDKTVASSDPPREILAAYRVPSGRVELTDVSPE